MKDSPFGRKRNIVPCRKRIWMGIGMRWQHSPEVFLMQYFYALDERGLSDRKQEVKDWYDGFTFGNKTDIYNPWSIINYLDKKQLGTYWTNTSSNSLAGKLIKAVSRNTI